ncbi:MAG: molybdenum cofactor biosynthesis F family protein, partial [Clostridiales bacterium]|nr:molybdenum cofactor biosynthesis F family protein [Clostridiales bacterium]
MTEQEVADLVLACPNYSVGDLVGRRPAFSGGLAGRELTLRADGDGPAISHRFLDEHRLLWREEGAGVAGDPAGVAGGAAEAWSGGDRAGSVAENGGADANGGSGAPAECAPAGRAWHEEYYEALQIDGDIYLLAYLRKGSRPATSLTCTLDLGMNLATMIVSGMGAPQAARYVSQHVWHGVIERDGMPAPISWRHHPTRDLVGRSMGWSYRDDMASQHIFGTPSSIAWVILTGPGSGLLGTAPCKYYKINDHVYLYSWVETQGSGQQGVVLMNTRLMHDVGTFYGIHHG